MSDELKSPDKVEASYDWDTDYQRHIISALLKDRFFLTRSLDLIEPSFFTQIKHRRICSSLFDFFKERKSVPPRFILLDEIKTKFHLTVDEVAIYDVEISALLDHYEPETHVREHLLDKIANFAKINAFKLAFNKSFDMIRNNPDSEEIWTKVYDVVRQSMTVEKSFDLGLDYFPTVRDRYERMNKEEETVERFTSGFDEIDYNLLGGGLRRGEIGAFMGVPGAGKSLCLVRSSVQNYFRGKKILYISFEMAEDDIARRFDAQIANEPINSLLANQKIIINKLEDEIKDSLQKTLIVIKQFPSGGADANTIRAYLSQAKMYGFTCDLLIVDYVGEMRDYPGMPLHESREKIVKDLRGLAVEEDLCVLTAIQPNRQAREAQKGTGVIDDSMIADSFGQTRPLHCLWTINCDDNEKDLNVGRIFVVKHRNGKSRFYVHYETDPRTLAMRCISYDTYKKLRHAQRELNAAEAPKEVKKPKFERNTDDN